MRVSIPKGYQPPIQKLMAQLQTDDPALAVNHVIGCWLASNSCPVSAIAPAASIQPSVAPAANDEFASITEW